MTAPAQRVEILRAGPEHCESLLHLFDRSATSCYCRYFHFPGDKYAWQDRVGNHADDNRSELAGRLREQDPEARGVVALDRTVREPQSIVGWLKLTPAELMGKQYENRLYRGLRCFERPSEGVFTVGCFFVDPARRREGIARRLLQGAIEIAFELGARSLEAFPHRSPDGEARPDALWLGPHELFEAAGFELVDNSVSSYPVLRKVLSKSC
jgi:GNAT superfamily N-acetyltransferase